MYTLFNLKNKFSKKTRQLFLLVAFLFISISASFAQTITIVPNATTPDGSKNAGDIINYSVAVYNSGAIPLNNVAISLPKTSNTFKTTVHTQCECFV